MKNINNLSIVLHLNIYICLLHYMQKKVISAASWLDPDIFDIKLSTSSKNFLFFDAQWQKTHKRQTIINQTTRGGSSAPPKNQRNVPEQKLRPVMRFTFVKMVRRYENFVLRRFICSFLCKFSLLSFDQLPHFGSPALFRLLLHCLQVLPTVPM